MEATTARNGVREAGVREAGVGEAGVGEVNRADGPVRVLLYGDVDLNILDGSAVWLTSMARTWMLAGAHVDVQLKAPEARTLLSGELHDQPGITVLPARPGAGEQSMKPARAAEVLQEADHERHYDVVMVRGIRICDQLARRSAFSGRLWSYVTEFEYPVGSVDPRRRETLGTIAAASRLMLAQTEQSRAVLEALVPAAAGRTVVLAPMVPEGLAPRPRPAAVGRDRTVHLVYTGKFARRWRTDLMPQIVGHLRRLGVDAELTMVGDKVHHEPVHPDWAENMRRVMDTSTPGITWAGARDRLGALELAGAADVTLGWRDEELDLSLELSTKVLESCALGVPPLVNRTVAHEALLGADYPLFADGAADGPEQIAHRIAGALEELPGLAQRVLAAAAPYRMDVCAQVLRGYLERLGVTGAVTGAVTGMVAGTSAPTAARSAGAAPGRPVRMVVAGHDLKFAGELIDMLSDRDDVELRLDQWSALHHHDETSSSRLADWADVVMCEWAGPNAVWYARHKRPGQRLVVRLHMFELRGQWLENLDTSAVDRFVTVSEHYRQLLSAQLHLPGERVTVIPNAVSTADLDRTGWPDRRHRLGLVGMVPLRKRLDRALDLLRELHRTDDRYTLHVRGRMPWEYPHEWRKPIQREAYLDLFARVGADPIRDAVAFEPFGADMANWLRKIGWVLSPSTVESFHLAPAEGMAAGALPLLWDRPGAREIFGDDFVVPDTRAATRFILDADRDTSRRSALQDVAQATVARFDEGRVSQDWAAVLGLPG